MGECEIVLVASGVGGLGGEGADESGDEAFDIAVLFIDGVVEVDAGAAGDLEALVVFGEEVFGQGDAFEGIALHVFPRGLTGIMGGVEGCVDEGGFGGDRGGFEEGDGVGLAFTGVVKPDEQSCRVD